MVVIKVWMLIFISCTLYNKDPGSKDPVFFMTKIIGK